MFDQPACPHCGRPFDSESDNTLVFASEPSQTIETIVPPTFTGDDGPDFEARAEIAREAPSPNGVHDRPGYSLPSGSGDAEPAGSSEFDALAAPVADPILDVIAQAEAEAPGAAAEPSGTRDEEPPGSSLAMVLLGSYASALTIAVAWLLWHSYARGQFEPDTLPPKAAARESSALAPLPPERVAALGKTLRVGSLEITPLTLVKRTVRLTWMVSEGRHRMEPGPETLVLRVRIKNVSKDETFAPLELAFLRRPDSGAGATFLAVGNRVVEGFPLAVASERSILGQVTPTLKPGESVETLVACDPEGKDRLTEPGTWRIKLRVNPEQTVAIGVAVGPEDVR